MPWHRTEPMNQRTEFALKAVKTENFRALCREYGISPKVGYKWKARLLSHGLEGMAEESRRPKAHPDALDEQTVCAIVRLRHRHPKWGARKLRDILLRQEGKAPSESSFKRVAREGRAGGQAQGASCPANGPPAHRQACAKSQRGVDHRL